ncbi:MAG: carbamate kinase [Desulfobacteraceae bacterium 4572_123]|nr:MAG: carbamate kinase [Desulfobacteraceae bacterium 4572_123]
MSHSSGKDIKPTLLIALGGNALIRKGQKGTITEQFDNLRISIRQIASLTSDYRIIITHGNGPQVGNLLLQQESCDAVPNLPLEILVAQTQGQIGYMIESVLDEALMEQGAGFTPLVSLITYVVVDEKDPGFANPTKPIGPFFTAAEAEKLDYPTVKTPKGFRRVVASPKPVTIIEKREIEQLIKSGFIVICCGGGGIPVVRNGRAFNGVDAVIDKDLVSALLATEVGADLLVIATDVDGVLADFNTPDQRLISRMNVGEAENFLHNDKSGKGSMGPKVAAAMQFIQGGGKRAVITSIKAICDSVQGTAGTQIIRTEQ